MAWKVVDCEERRVPWDGWTEGTAYWALLQDTETGKELEFELFDLDYYESEWEVLRMIEVRIDGTVDFSETFSKREAPRVFRELKRRYLDIFDALRRDCKVVKVSRVSCLV